MIRLDGEAYARTPPGSGPGSGSFQLPASTGIG